MCVRVQQGCNDFLLMFDCYSLVNMFKILTNDETAVEKYIQNVRKLCTSTMITNITAAENVLLYFD